VNLAPFVHHLGFVREVQGTTRERQLMMGISVKKIPLDTLSSFPVVGIWIFVAQSKKCYLRPSKILVLGND